MTTSMVSGSATGMAPASAGAGQIHEHLSADDSSIRADPAEIRLARGAADGILEPGAGEGDQRWQVRAARYAMPGIDIRQARSAADLEHAQAIRRQVFVAEQGVAEGLEIDGRDATARHLLALRRGRPVGTLRLRWLDGDRTVKIERVAVLAAARGQNVGRSLICAALDLARAEGAKEARLHAQTAVQTFYQRLGFVACGSEFIEDGIPHTAMRRGLTNPASEEMDPA